jgi:non-ribosomal peptide synthetase component F
LDYWTKQLAGASVEAGYAEKSGRSYYRSSTYRFRLPDALGSALRKLSHQENVTLFMTLFTAFSTVLPHLTGQRDLVVGTSVARRNTREIENLIGLFAEIFMLRINLAGVSTWRNLLQRVQQLVLELSTNQDLSLLDLQRSLGGKTWSAPRYRVFFAMYDTPLQSYTLDALSVRSENIDYPASLDLEVHIEETPDIHVALVYRNACYTPEIIERFARAYERALEKLVSDLDGEISEHTA